MRRTGHHTLNAVLSGSKGIASLGGLTWTVSDAAQARIDILGAVVAVIEEAGRPLGIAEIGERLQPGRGIGKSLRITPGAPPVYLRNGLWGIDDPDGPVKRARQRELIETPVGQLEARRSGIHESEPGDFLSLDGCCPGTFISIAARDGRLRTTGGRCIHLAQWGDPRRHTVKSALLEVGRNPGGPLSFRETVRRVEALAGGKCGRTGISTMLHLRKVRAAKRAGRRGSDKSAA